MFISYDSFTGMLTIFALHGMSFWIMIGYIIDS